MIKIDHYLIDWVRDYYIAHNQELNEPFLYYYSKFPTPLTTSNALLKKALSQPFNCLDTIELSSSFKITSGQFYKRTNPELIDQCVCHVIKSLSDLFKTNGIEFKQLFSQICNEYYGVLFRNAIYDKKPIVQKSVKLTDFETFKQRKNGWVRQYYTFDLYRRTIGYILKFIEYKMRELSGYQSLLQRPKISQVENNLIQSELSHHSYPYNPTIGSLKQWKRKTYELMSKPEFETTIHDAILDFYKNSNIVVKSGKITKIKPVEIDMSQLERIQMEHEETAMKLNIEEYPDQIIEQPNISTPDISLSININGDFVHSLTNTESTVLKYILNNEFYNIQCMINETGTPLELIIESINEKALECIGDNIVDTSNETPYIYDEYKSFFI